MNAAVPERGLPGWEAELKLRFAVRPSSARTVLAERQHRGPLIVQRPFHPEGDPCHVYLVHPPGGVVGGDALSIEVQVDPGAHAVITTPAATKFYRCEGRRSSQRQRLQVTGGKLEWLPQENIFFRGAETDTGTRVTLQEDSRFIGWEIACLGLPARREHFDQGALRLDFELWKGTTPVFIDRLRLTGASLARGARFGLAGHEALGTLLATPATGAQVEIIRELVAEFPEAAVSLVDGVLVLRALAAQAEPIRHLFIRAWRALRPAIIEREAVLPRIWAT